MRPSTRLAVAGVLALSAFAAAPAARAKVPPLWSLTRAYSVGLPVGFRSVAGQFAFAWPGGDGSDGILPLSYDEKANLVGTFIHAGSGTFFPVAGSWSVDETGAQHVTLTDAPKDPSFRFDGVLAADGGDVVGTCTAAAGVAGLAESMTNAPFTFERQGGPGTDSFVLDFISRMDSRGVVRGAPTGVDGEEAVGSMTVFGDRTLGDGKIRGKVKTKLDGTTWAVVKVTGRKWRAKLTGPVVPIDPADPESGGEFHATVDVKGAGFAVTAIQATLPVVYVPPPPGPPPPDPYKRIRLSGATASVVEGQVTITHTDVPLKFFDVPAGLTITYPDADGVNVAHTADPSTASVAPIRRCIVTTRRKTYSTTNPAVSPTPSVTLTVKERTATTISVLADGQVVAEGGSKKSVKILVEATIQ